MINCFGLIYFLILVFTTRSEQIALYQGTDLAGNQHAITVDSDILMRLPDWSPDQNLPLTITEAVNIANKAFNSRYGPEKVSRIEIMNFSDFFVTKNELNKKWFYLISFRGEKHPIFPRFQLSQCVVLFDGTVIKEKPVEIGSESEEGNGRQ